MQRKKQTGLLRDMKRADENDNVNSAWKKKKKTGLLRDMKRVNGNLAMLLQWLNKILFTATSRWHKNSTMNCILPQTFLTKKPTYN